MVITSYTKTKIRSDVKDDIEAFMTYGAVGSGTTTPAESDTALVSEDFRDAIDEFDKSAADKVVASLRILTTENNGNTISEAGFFDAASGGNLLTRNTLTSINKTSDIQVYVDVQITIEVVEV